GRRWWMGECSSAASWERVGRIRLPHSMPRASREFPGSPGRTRGGNPGDYASIEAPVTDLSPRSTAPSIPGLDAVVESLGRRARAVAGRAVLIGVSGIDASGKGVVAAGIASGLSARGLRVASLALDPWHQPAAVRFGGTDPGAHFYAHAFRWGE